MVYPLQNRLTPKLRQSYKKVLHKKVLCIIVDENLDFNQQIQERKKYALQSKRGRLLNVLNNSSTIIMDVVRL